MSYRDLEIYNLAHMLVIDIHKMTLQKLPRFEIFEEGCQIRRSSKSVKSNIVEGYGRRRHIKEYLRFLIYALSSNDETMDHLDNLHVTESLKDIEMYQNLYRRIDILGRKINLFIQSIEART